MPSQEKKIERACQLARERYAKLDVDIDRALGKLSGISISMHCRQGDDVAGFENMSAELGGGLAVTGNYPGKARTQNELKADFEKAVSLIQGLVKNASNRIRIGLALNQPPVGWTISKGRKP